MAITFDIYGELVDALRTRRSDGTSVSELVQFLSDQGLELHAINDHISAAFALSGAVNLEMLSKDRSSVPEPKILDVHVAKLIDDRKPEWQAADPYPDLMRRRDRQAFKEVARLHDSVIVVCAANPHSGSYIGTEGFEPLPHFLPGLPRSENPDKGLIAVDPNEPRLMQLLQGLNPKWSYSDYVNYLNERGYLVHKEGKGYVLEDADGVRFHPAYKVHGMYKKETGENAWTGSSGEHIRSQLNRRMEKELVQTGPHDQWDIRQTVDPQHPLWAPQVPVLFFLPSGHVEVRFHKEGMERYYRFLNIDWDSLYPNPA